MKFELLLSKKVKLSLFFLLLLIFIMGASFVLAVRERWRAPEIEYPPVPFLSVERPNDFIQKIRDEVPGYTPEKALALYIRYFYSLFLMISGLIAFGAVFFGGFLYLISAGNPTQMIKAREQITAGVLGLMILLSSYLILTTLNPQLIVSPSFSLNKIIPPVIDIPAVNQEANISLFQVPTGRIIERSTLDAEGERKLNQIKEIVSSTKVESENLKNLSEELKNLTNACTCGQSQCSGPSSCGGIDCDSSCDFGAIAEKKNRMRESINRLKSKEPQIVAVMPLLINDYLEFKRAGLLMSAPLGVMDYNSMLGYRYFVEQKGQSIQIVTDVFEKWDDNKIIVNGATIADPATFYFDKSKLGNNQVIEQAQGLFVDLDAPFIIEPPPGIILPPPGPRPGPGDCQTPPDGLCSIETLNPAFGESASQASQICFRESGGNKYSLNTGCETGISGDYSVGLFQINLTPRCPGAFIYPYQGNYNRCLVIDQTKVETCKVNYGYGELYQNNILRARDISGGGSSWCPWSTACPQYCNLCNDRSYTSRYCGAL